MDKKSIQGKTSLNIHKVIRYAWGQLKNTFPNETKRENKGAEFCLVVAGAHKVGSTWVAKMLKDLNVFRTLPVPKDYRSNKKNFALIGLHKIGVDEYFRNTKGFRLYKSHSEPPVWDLEGKVRFVTVIRDPRDVVISNIFYLANLAPELGGWPELQNLSLDERIRVYLKRGVFDLELLDKWSQYAPASKLYYEELLQSPQTLMEQMFDEMKLKVSTQKCSQIIKSNTFDRLSGGRVKGQENTGSFFRKGVAGDWRNYFGEREIERFKTENNGGWNKLLVRLGYETSDDWQ